MKKRGYVRYAAVALSLALMAGMGLTGCDSKKKVDYGFEDDTEGNDTGAMLSSKLNVPESYKGTLSGISTDTGLSAVRIDAAEISVPDTDRMSVQYCQKNSIDNEYKKRICENFFDMNDGVYIYDWDKPYKGDVEKEIANIQEMADNASDGETKAMYEDAIKDMQSDLRNAADEREGAGDYTADCFVGNKKGALFMASFEEGNDAAPGFEIYMLDDGINYRPKEGALDANCYSSDFSYGMTLPDNTAKITQDTAIDQGLEFLASCGITNVVETDCVGNLWQYYDQNGENVGNELDGYVITYKRGIDGVAVYTPDVYDLDALNSASEDGEGDINYESENEKFTVTIDDQGILAVSGTDAVRMTDKKESNVDLLSWDDILKLLPDAVNSFYKENKTQYSEITFNDVRLTYYKLKDGDGYKYAPVWAFSECTAESDGSLNKLIPPTQIIMLDAQNGQLIDMRDSLYISDI